MPTSFFTGTTAANIWRGVTGVSPAGLRRGRGKGTGRALVKDFNKGQRMGVGSKRLLLPGLNSRFTGQNQSCDIQEIGEDPEYKPKLEQFRKEMDVYKKFRQHPLDRGWSGRMAHGKAAGQPSDVNETSFDGFESTVLMLRNMEIMTGLRGRTKIMKGLVVTGNKNGLAGFACVTGSDGKSVVRHARNKASQSLVYVPRWEEHTVLHDFFSRYYDTTVFVERKPRGHGIRAHRIIKAICEMIGITDLYAKVEGVTRNQINVTTAFFLGLINQRNYQDIANEKRLHLVDVREENFYYPQVLASPESPILSDADLKRTNENLDFTYYIYDGKIKMIKQTRNPWYQEGHTWVKHLDKMDYVKNREHTKLLLAAKYGDTKVIDVFPHFKTTAASFNKAEESG